jgi:hypothetical protein
MQAATVASAPGLWRLTVHVRRGTDSADLHGTSPSSGVGGLGGVGYLALPRSPWPCSP